MIRPLTRKKPYSRGSQPYIINRWLEGDAKARGVRPKSKLVYEGVMLPPDGYSLEVRNDRIFAYGEMVAKRGPDGQVHINLVVTNPMSAMIARKVYRFANVRGVEVVTLGPNGTPLQAAEMRLLAMEKDLRRKIPASQWSGAWRLQHAARELKAVASVRGVDPDRLEKLLYGLKAKVTLGRLQGWSETACKNILTEITAAQHALEVTMPRRAA